MNRTYLLKLISDYKIAAVQLSWIGTKDPEDHELIKYEHREAKRKLNAYIYKNTRPY